jgi:hypothetical protein
MLKCICIFSTLLLTSCFSVQQGDDGNHYLGYKNIELRGIVNIEDHRIIPQKPPGLDNAVVIKF